MCGGQINDGLRKHVAQDGVELSAFNVQPALPALNAKLSTLNPGEQSGGRFVSSTGQSDAARA